MSNEKHHYVYGLDVLRAFSILLVITGHTFEHSTLPPGIASFRSLGALGVELFFVLSGFLIGSILIELIDRGRLQNLGDVKEFWKRRWLRTIPLYIVAYCAFIRFDYHGRHEFSEYPQYLIFLQNFAWRIPEFFELSWSLAIEEHFYLWFPLVYLLCYKVTRKALFSLLLTATLFTCIAYLYRLHYPQFNDWNEYSRIIRLGVLARLDAIMFGVAIAAIKRYAYPVFGTIRTLTPFWIAAFVLICCWYYLSVPGLLQSRILQVNLYTVQSLALCLLLPWFDGIKNRPDTGLARFLVFTSRISYSLYLVHILVIIAVNHVLLRFQIYDLIYQNPVVLYPIYFAFFYLSAWVTYSTIEQPFLRLRNIPFSWQEWGKSSAVALGILFYLIVIA